MSVVTALASTAVPKVAFSTEYDQAVTGDAATDTQYSVATDADGNQVYRFQDGDSISMETDSSTSLRGVNLLSAAAPVVFDVGGGSGKLNVVAHTGSIGSWNTTFGVNVEGWSSNLTMNGDLSVSSQSDDATPMSAALGVRVSQGTATFNGDTTITTSTPGYTQGLWVYQGQVTFNGDTNISVAGRGENTDGIHNAGGGTGNVVFNGDVDIVSYGTWPSDNVHGIYNDDGNTKLAINGDLSLAATSNGSTVFGIRNQGRVTVTGDATIGATGPRSAFGIANTYRTASMSFGGDVSIDVVNGGGYTPFGLPTAVANVYGRGSSITFGKGAAVTIAANAETYGINNSGIVNFASDTDTAVLRANSACDGCAVYGISNTGGVITFAGGLDAQATATGAGIATLVRNVATEGQTGEISINAAGKARVSLSGNIVTGSLTNASGDDFEGTTTINLVGENSYLKGQVLGYADPDASDSLTYRSGATWLTFANGAVWQPTGSDSLVSDLGAGGLTLASGGIIDMAGSWGTFSPASVPGYALRSFQIDSSTGNGTVTLEDGAKFLLLSDIRNGEADRVVFGSGITNFSATGTQHVGIVYDPVLDDTSWIDEAATQVGKWIEALSDVEVIDASAAAGGSANLSTVGGLESGWRGTYENDLIAFTYKPTLELAGDGSKVLLTGITILGNGDPGDGSDGGSDGGSSGGTDDGSNGGSDGSDNGSGGGSDDGIDEGSGGGTDDGSGVGSDGDGKDADGEDGGESLDPDGGIRPSESVLTSAEAAGSLRNLLFSTSELTRSPAVRAAMAPNVSMEGSNAWFVARGGRDQVDAAYSRGYRQDVQAVSMGVAETFTLADSALILGVGLTQGHANADYQQGQGKLRSSSLDLHVGMVAETDAYLWFGVSAASLRNDYHSIDSQGRRSAGAYRTQAAVASVEAGWPISLAGGWSVIPQASISSGRIDGDHHQTTTGIAVDMAGTTFTLARAGATLSHAATGPRVQRDIYIRMLGVGSRGHAPEIVASKDGGSISPATRSERHGGYEFAVGTSLSMAKSRLRVFADVGRQRSGDATSEWTATAGIGYRW